MKKAGKIALKLASMTFVIAALSACGQTGAEKANQPYVEPIYEEKVVFIENYDNKHIDVLAEKKKKMYAIPDSLKDSLKDIKENDTLLIEYSLDKDLKRNIKSIKVVGKAKEVVKEEKKEEESEKIQNEKKTESINVYLNGKWQEEEATVEETSYDYSVKVLENYQVSDNKISSETNTSYVKIDVLPIDTEIKPQRWNAADNLKKIGDLKELKGENIYDPNFRDAEFVFTATNGEIRQNYVLKKKDGQLLRYIMSFPISSDKKNEAQLWAMMEQIEFN